MTGMTCSVPPHEPLLLLDRLLTRTDNADKAGSRTTAASLLSLASDVLDQPALLRR